LLTKKKLLSGVVAACMGLSLSLASAPVAEAGIFESVLNIGGAVLSMEQYKAEANKYIEYYNNTEQGRHELFYGYQKQMGVVEDYDVNVRLDNIMGELLGAVDQVDGNAYEKPYIYFINQQQDFNAFCSMGHVVSVNQGLLNLLSSDDEVAVVIGHELFHGQNNHPEKGMRRTINHQSTAVLANAIAGDTVFTNIVGSLALKQANAHYDKEDEWDADNGAFDYMMHTGYNPGATAAVWQRVLDSYGSNAQNSGESFFNPSDHPNNEARRDNYEKRLYEYSNKHVRVQDGVVKVNGKTFTQAAPTGDMSGAERTYFVMGNLVAAYHNGDADAEAYVADGTVMLGNQDIITPVEGDEPAEVLAARLNAIK